MTSYTHNTAPTEFIEADGTRFTYRRFGNPTGTPMVLLQHFMGNLGNYDPGHQRRPNVVVDQSFAWITVDVRSVAIERG